MPTLKDCMPFLGSRYSQLDANDSANSMQDELLNCLKSAVDNLPEENNGKYPQDLIQSWSTALNYECQKATVQNGEKNKNPGELFREIRDYLAPEGTNELDSLSGHLAVLINDYPKTKIIDQLKKYQEQIKKINQAIFIRNDYNSVEDQKSAFSEVIKVLLKVENEFCSEFLKKLMGVMDTFEENSTAIVAVGHINAIIGKHTAVNSPLKKFIRQLNNNADSISIDVPNPSTLKSQFIAFQEQLNEYYPPESLITNEQLEAQKKSVHSAKRALAKELCTILADRQSELMEIIEANKNQIAEIKKQGSSYFKKSQGQTLDENDELLIYLDSKLSDKCKIRINELQFECDKAQHELEQRDRILREILSSDQIGNQFDYTNIDKRTEQVKQSVKNLPREIVTVVKENIKFNPFKSLLSSDDLKYRIEYLLADDNNSLSRNSSSSEDNSGGSYVELNEEQLIPLQNLPVSTNSGNPVGVGLASQKFSESQAQQAEKLLLKLMQGEKFTSEELEQLEIENVRNNSKANEAYSRFCPQIKKLETAEIKYQNYQNKQMLITNVHHQWIDVLQQLALTPTASKEQKEFARSLTLQLLKLTEKASDKQLEEELIKRGYAIPGYSHYVTLAKAVIKLMIQRGLSHHLHIASPYFYSHFIKGEEVSESEIQKLPPPLLIIFGNYNKKIRQMHCEDFDSTLYELNLLRKQTNEHAIKHAASISAKLGDNQEKLLKKRIDTANKNEQKKRISKAARELFYELALQGAGEKDLAMSYEKFFSFSPEELNDIKNDNGKEYQLKKQKMQEFVQFVENYIIARQKHLRSAQWQRRLWELNTSEQDYHNLHVKKLKVKLRRFAQVMSIPMTLQTGAAKVTRDLYDRKHVSDEKNYVLNEQADHVQVTFKKVKDREAKRVNKLASAIISVIVAVGQGVIAGKGMFDFLRDLTVIILMVTIGFNTASIPLAILVGLMGTATNSLLYYNDLQDLLNAVRQTGRIESFFWSKELSLPQNVFRLIVGTVGAGATSALMGWFAMSSLMFVFTFGMPWTLLIVGAVGLLTIVPNFAMLLQSVSRLLQSMTYRNIRDFIKQYYFDPDWNAKTWQYRTAHVFQCILFTLTFTACMAFAVLGCINTLRSMQGKFGSTTVDIASQLGIKVARTLCDNIGWWMALFSAPIELALLMRAYKSLNNNMITSVIDRKFFNKKLENTDPKKYFRFDPVLNASIKFGGELYSEFKQHEILKYKLSKANLHNLKRLVINNVSKDEYAQQIVDVITKNKLDVRELLLEDANDLQFVKNIISACKNASQIQTLVLPQNLFQSLKGAYNEAANQIIAEINNVINHPDGISVLGLDNGTSSAAFRDLIKELNLNAKSSLRTILVSNCNTNLNLADIIDPLMEKRGTGNGINQFTLHLRNLNDPKVTNNGYYQKNLPISSLIFEKVSSDNIATTLETLLAHNEEVLDCLELRDLDVTAVKVALSGNKARFNTVILDGLSAEALTAAIQCLNSHEAKEIKLRNMSNKLINKAKKALLIQQTTKGAFIDRKITADFNDNEMTFPRFLKGFGKVIGYPFIVLLVTITGIAPILNALGNGFANMNPAFLENIGMRASTAVHSLVSACVGTIQSFALNIMNILAVFRGIARPVPQGEAERLHQEVTVPVVNVVKGVTQSITTENNLSDGKISTLRVHPHDSSGTQSATTEDETPASTTPPHVRNISAAICSTSHDEEVSTSTEEPASEYSDAASNELRCPAIQPIPALPLMKEWFNFEHNNVPAKLTAEFTRFYKPQVTARRKGMQEDEVELMEELAAGLENLNSFAPGNPLTV